MKHYPISKKEILSRVTLTLSHKIEYFYAWLVMFSLVIITCVLVRTLDYLFKSQPIIDIWSDTGMYVQMTIWTILFIIYSKKDHQTFPFFITKKWMNSPLTKDVTQAYYLVDTATLLKIENIVATHLAPAHQRLYLQLEQQKNSTWFTVYSSLLWARLQHNSEFHLTDECLGQKLKICYLPQSQIILQLFAQQNLQQDLAYSKVLQRLYQPLPSEKIKHIPSQLQYAFLSSQSIRVEPTSIHQQQFELQITAAQQKQVNISSTEPHFDLFYSVLQQSYKLPDLCKIQQQISTSSKVMTLYDLSKQPKNIRWVLFTLSGIFFILSVLHTVFIFFAIFMFIAALLTKFVISRFDYLKILEND